MNKVRKLFKEIMSVEYTKLQRMKKCAVSENCKFY